MHTLAHIYTHTHTDRYTPKHILKLLVHDISSLKGNKRNFKDLTYFKTDTTLRYLAFILNILMFHFT